MCAPTCPVHRRAPGRDRCRVGQAQGRTTCRSFLAPVPAATVRYRLFGSVGPFRVDAGAAGVLRGGAVGDLVAVEEVLEAARGGTGLRPAAVNGRTELPVPGFHSLGRALRPSCPRAVHHARPLLRWRSPGHSSPDRQHPAGGIVMTWAERTHRTDAGPSPTDGALTGGAQRPRERGNGAARHGRQSRCGGRRAHGGRGGRLPRVLPRGRLPRGRVPPGRAGTGR